MSFFRKYKYKLIYKLSWGQRRQLYKKKYNSITYPMITNATAHHVYSNVHEIKMLCVAQKLHEKTFAKYKNSNQGKTVVIVATGPTLEYFSPIDNVVYIGVNRAVLYNKVSLDYLFMQDYLGLHYIEEAAKLEKTKKFYGIMPPDLVSGWIIPESIALRHKAERYYATAAWDPRCIDKSFPYDIASEPLRCYGSVVLPAMQFALYTNPAKIILVGCDTTRLGYFNEKGENPLEVRGVLNGWAEMKRFATMYYPETEIISLNPVGLKGMFNDEYTVEESVLQNV